MARAMRLAVEAGRPHRREALAALFWPEMPDQQARKNLRMSLYRLRQAIDEVAPGVSETVLTVDRNVAQLHDEGRSTGKLSVVAARNDRRPWKS